MEAFSVLMKVAAAISRGAILLTPRWSVGPYKVATSPEPLWACLDLTGSVVGAYQDYRETEIRHAADRTGWSAQCEHRSERDWSAFGAARAFLSCAGVHEAELALARLDGASGSDPAAPPSIRLKWVTLDADRNGRPVTRCARLPRLRWPGLCVWHERRGGYELMHEVTADVVEPTGFRFASQRELFAHLHSIPWPVHCTTRRA